MIRSIFFCCSSCTRLEALTGSNSILTPSRRAISTMRSISKPARLPLSSTKPRYGASFLTPARNTPRALTSSIMGLSCATAVVTGRASSVRPSTSNSNGFMLYLLQRNLWPCDSNGCGAAPGSMFEDLADEPPRTLLFGAGEEHLGFLHLNNLTAVHEGDAVR